MRHIRNVSVLNRFNTGSDHRLVRAAFCFDAKSWPRRKPTLKAVRRSMHRTIYRHAIENRFRKQPIDDETDVNDAYKTIIDNISLAMQTANVTEELPSALSDQTHELLRIRREMKQDANFWTKIEYAEICKLIRIRSKEEIRQHHIRIVAEAIRTGKLRRARSELAEGRKQMISVKETRRNDNYEQV